MDIGPPNRTGNDGGCDESKCALSLSKPIYRECETWLLLEQLTTGNCTTSRDTIVTSRQSPLASKTNDTDSGTNAWQLMNVLNFTFAIKEHLPFTSERERSRERERERERERRAKCKGCQLAIGFPFPCKSVKSPLEHIL